MVKVSIIKSKEPDVKKALDMIEFAPQKHDLVVIKPNLCAPLHYSTGATTDLRILEQVINIFEEHAGKIVIVESDGPFATAEESLEKTKMKAVCDYYGIEFVNLSKDICIPVKREYNALDNFKTPRTILKADFLVNLPVMKTHELTTVSLSLKNWFGIVPWRKAVYHPRISEVICDLLRIRKPDLNIMDGIIGMEGGPTKGRAKEMNLVLASEDAVALDTVCCNIMRINPHHVEHLQRACYYNLGACTSNKIQVVGGRIKDVSSKFVL